MGQIKIQDVAWIECAWNISELIDEMPPAPSGLLTACEPPPLSELQRMGIEYLQAVIALHLAYRLKVVHKYPRDPDDKRAMYIFEDRDPDVFGAFYGWVTLQGVGLRPVDYSAIKAYRMLGRIRLDRWISHEWKRTLPLIVASISDVAASRTASAKARRPRSRRNDLKQAKVEFTASNPDASWKELLDILEGEGIVTAWDAETIHWTSDGGQMRTLATKTFRNWTVSRKT